MSNAKATEVVSMPQILAAHAETEGVTDASLGRINVHRVWLDEGYRAGVDRALRALQRGGAAAVRAEVRAAHARS